MLRPHLAFTLLSLLAAQHSTLASCPSPELFTASQLISFIEKDYVRVDPLSLELKRLWTRKLIRILFSRAVNELHPTSGSEKIESLIAYLDSQGAQRCALPRTDLQETWDKSSDALLELEPTHPRLLEASYYPRSNVYTRREILAEIQDLNSALDDPQTLIDRRRSHILEGREIWDAIRIYHFQVSHAETSYSERLRETGEYLSSTPDTGWLSGWVPTWTPPTHLPPSPRTLQEDSPSIYIANKWFRRKSSFDYYSLPRLQSLKDLLTKFDRIFPLASEDSPEGLPDCLDLIR